MSECIIFCISQVSYLEGLFNFENNACSSLFFLLDCCQVVGGIMKKLKAFLLTTCLCVAGGAYAQFAQDIEGCEILVANAETEPANEIYAECGFDDVQTAFVHWAPLAEQRRWKNAMYELYSRHPNYPGIKTFIYKAAEFGHPEALLYVGDELYEQGKISEAMRYYNRAIHGNISDESQGRITGRLGVLYANPESSYYDYKKAVPLLRKAAQQRNPLANNIMGVYTLLGQNGVRRDPQEAFKYFWRAALLGCTAAEENLGFFMLGHQRQISGEVVSQEVSDRLYSCDGVSTTRNNLPIKHFTFSPKECANINYYAERLVDTTLPFVGKEQCAFSADMNEMADFLTKE